MSDTKACFKCGAVKGIDEFYRHPMMTDGRLGKCKDCTKVDVRSNRAAKLDYYRDYDRARGSRRTAGDTRRYRHANPEKSAAHSAVGHALRRGQLVRQPCEVCGRTRDVHAHHDDYAQKLAVRWLCAEHHVAHHQRGN